MGLSQEIQKPKLEFSPWIPWSERGKYDDGKWPGVYIIAITEKNLAGQTPDGFQDVDYIGMSISQGGLHSRWNQFDSSIRGGWGHSGGKHVMQELGIHGKWKDGLNIFVAGLPVQCEVRKESRTPEDLIKMGWVAFLEFEAMAEFKKERNLPGSRFNAK